MTDGLGSRSGLTELGRSLVGRRRARAAALAISGSGVAEAECQAGGLSLRKERMSQTQAAIWLFEKLYPGTCVNSLRCLISLDGEIDVAALAQALKLVTSRHDILLATAESAEPALVWTETAELALRVVDAGDGECPDGCGQALWERDAAEPFDLENGPLVRAILYRTGPSQSLLLLVAHHLVADGATLSPLLDDITATYAGLVAAPQEPRHRWPRPLAAPPARGGASRKKNEKDDDDGDNNGDDDEEEEAPAPAPPGEDEEGRPRGGLFFSFRPEGTAGRCYVRRAHPCVRSETPL